MDCEKCGAEVTEAADTCPECGEPLAAETPDTFADAAAPAADQDTPPTADEPDAGEDAKPGSLNKKAGLIALVGLLVVVALAAVALFVPIGGASLYSKMTNVNDPATVAKRMLDAYAKYDAAGILATTNSSAMAAADKQTFEDEAGKAKERAKGKDGVKDYKVGTVTIDPKDPTKAMVEVTGMWLQDPEKGEYAQRTDQLPMIQQGGKWVVQIF